MCACLSHIFWSLNLVHPPSIESNFFGFIYYFIYRALSPLTFIFHHSLFSRDIKALGVYHQLFFILDCHLGHPIISKLLRALPIIALFVFIVCLLSWVNITPLPNFFFISFKLKILKIYFIVTLLVFLELLISQLLLLHCVY